MLKLKRKPKKLYILIDCLGAIDSEEVYGSHYISRADRMIAQYENPNRSLENQTGTAYYLTQIFNDIVEQNFYHSVLQQGFQIILMGTTAEIATAKRYVPTDFDDVLVFSKPVGLINTADKWKFARELEKSNYKIIILTDDKLKKVYETLKVVVGSYATIKGFERSVDKSEKIFTPWKTVKALAIYGSKV